MSTSKIRGTQLKGRKVIKTNHELVGNLVEDSRTILKMLPDILMQHEENVVVQDELFNIYFNSGDYWSKSKEQRVDINNHFSIPKAWAISRTINFYCFTEPIKYVARDTAADKKLQDKVEILGQMLDNKSNHNSTVMATLSASICGLGYKLALPANKQEFEEDGIPFIINSHFIQPQKAFCVYSNSIIPKKVLGVYVGNNYKNENDEIEKQYTVWTNYHQFIVVENNSGTKKSYKIKKQSYAGGKVDGYPLQTNKIPLIEVERNAFRKGDWEVVTDLLKLKNMIVSNRADDIQQVVDYILVMMNCKFLDDDERDAAIRSRVMELEQTGSGNKPQIEILKNALDQNGVQIFEDYIDDLIDEAVGMPSRASRSGGGHDTGKAVMLRNGFRDLENNAGFIIPKMDKAELEFISLCLSYANVMTGQKNTLFGLKAKDVRNKFLRTLSDDPVSTATAYSIYRNAGMNDLNALMESKCATDPAEVAKNNLNEFVKGQLLFQQEAATGVKIEKQEKEFTGGLNNNL